MALAVDFGSDFGVVGGREGVVVGVRNAIVEMYEGPAVVGGACIDLVVIGLDHQFCFDSFLSADEINAG